MYEAYLHVYNYMHVSIIICLYLSRYNTGPCVYVHMKGPWLYTKVQLSGCFPFNTFLVYGLCAPMPWGWEGRALLYSHCTSTQQELVLLFLNGVPVQHSEQRSQKSHVCWNCVKTEAESLLIVAHVFSGTRNQSCLAKVAPCPGLDNGEQAGGLIFSPDTCKSFVQFSQSNACILCTKAELNKHWQSQ